MDGILEKMAKRFMVRDSEVQRSIIDEDVRELIDLAISDEVKRKKKV